MIMKQQIINSKTLSELSTRFFYISNTFINNTRMKLAKNQANAKQHSEAELSLFENYSHSSSTLSSNHSKIIGHILKNKQNNKGVCIHEIIRLILMKKINK